MLSVLRRHLVLFSFVIITCLLLLVANWYYYTYSTVPVNYNTVTTPLPNTSLTVLYTSGSSSHRAKGERHDQALARADQLTWTSLQNGSNKDTNFFSAYYDGRKGVPEGPAVVVFGYHMKSLKSLNLYCLFTYADRTSACLAEAAKQVKSCSGHLDGDKAASSFKYVCRMKCKAEDCTDEEIPQFVALSDNSKCASPSGQIPVHDHQLSRTIDKKTFGVCVQSPLYGQSIGVQQISAFIEMNRALGAEIITLYVMDMEKDMFQFLTEHYSKQGLLQLLKWKKVEKWNPLHYFGQSLMMHDCLYRNMYRVKYLAVVDLDELLLPSKYQNWPEMINAIGGQDKYHSYRFGNCFFARNNAEATSITIPCNKVHLPKYFQWTSRLKCFCTDKDTTTRPKYMVQSELIIDMYIHWVCKATRGEEYVVPHSVGSNAHFREAIPQDCTDKRTTHDTTLLKYRSGVVEAMGRHMCTQQ